MPANIASWLVVLGAAGLALWSLFSGKKSPKASLLSATETAKAMYLTSRGSPVEATLKAQAASIISAVRQHAVKAKASGNLTDAEYAEVMRAVITVENLLTGATPAEAARVASRESRGLPT